MDIFLANSMAQHIGCVWKSCHSWWFEGSILGCTQNPRPLIVSCWRASSVRPWWSVAWNNNLDLFSYWTTLLLANLHSTFVSLNPLAPRAPKWPTLSWNQYHSGLWLKWWTRQNNHYIYNANWSTVACLGIGSWRPLPLWHAHNSIFFNATILVPLIELTVNSALCSGASTDSLPQYFWIQGWIYMWKIQRRIGNMNPANIPGHRQHTILFYFLSDSWVIKMPEGLANAIWLKIKNEATSN